MYKIILINFYGGNGDSIEEQFSNSREKFGIPKIECDENLKNNFGYFPKKYYILNEEETFYFKMKYPDIISEIMQI